jgi:DNA polymerase-3 subunit delta
MAKPAAFKPLYLVLSEQSFLRSQPLNRLRIRLEQEAQDGDMDFNTDVFSAPEDDPEAIIAAANTIPFGTPHRLVVVKNIESYPTDALKALAEYARTPNQMTILMLIGEKLAKNSSLYKAVAATGSIMERKTPSARELPQLVVGLFAEEGLTVDLPTSRALINLVGNDLNSLRTAIQKVKVSVGERSASVVTRGDIAAIVGETVEVKLWEFTAALGQRDLRKALDILSRSLEQDGTIFAAHSMALRSIRDLLTARAHQERGDTDLSLLASELGRPEWLTRRTLEQASRYRSDELRCALTALAQVGLRMKTSQPLVGRLALERWVIETCGT